jgi:ubiquinol-cytochrome c reductase cytochrome b subunit
MANIISRLSVGMTNWVNARAPGLSPVYKKHMTEYYAPKNFNFWYIFGV